MERRVESNIGKMPDIQNGVYHRVGSPSSSKNNGHWSKKILFRDILDYLSCVYVMGNKKCCILPAIDPSSRKLSGPRGGDFIFVF